MKPIRGNSSPWCHSTLATTLLGLSHDAALYEKLWKKIFGFLDGDSGEVNWIIETKGRVWESTGAKDEAITEWCARISEEVGAHWCYARVDQQAFQRASFSTLADLLDQENGAQLC